MQSIKVYPENPNPTAVAKIVSVLENDGVIVYPTDTVYAIGCSIKSPKAIERLRIIKGKKTTMMSIACADMSNLADYAKVSTPVFKILKRHLPGGYTFILPCSPKTPDKVLQGRKTIGFRIPDNNIAREIIQQLGFPLVTTSVRKDGLEEEYLTDPSLIMEAYPEVDLVVDGGMGDNFASTVVDCTMDEPEVIRQGRAEFE